jgi:peptidoglycan hydrolase-like protein with peptidoglycan-binding domain
MAKDHDIPEDPFFDENSEHKPENPEEKPEDQGKEDESEEQTDATNEASDDHVDPTFEDATAAPESSPASEEKIEYVQHVEEPEEDAYSSPDYGDVQPDASLDYGYTAALRKLYADPAHLREVAEWETAQNAPLPMPPDNFPEDPTLIAQGDTQTTAEATHPENVNSHTQTAQHDGHGDHHAKQGEASHQPKAAPELDAVGAGNATIREGHQGEAVGEIQRLLGLEADGNFSTDLASQIAKFQEDEGINPTGIVDQVTLQLLQEVEEERLRANQSTPSKTETKTRSFNLGVEEERGFPQTPATHTESNGQQTEKPQLEEHQDNFLQQAARIINEGELGLVEGYVTSTVAPLDPESAKAFENLHNNTPFNAGKALGDAVAGAQAVLGIVEGVLTIGGGVGELGVGIAADSALEDALGAATVVAGVGMVG